MSMRSIGQKNKIAAVDFLQNVALLYMIAWGISPPLAYGTAYRLLFIGAFLIWECIALKKQGYALLESQIKVGLLLLAIVGISVIADGVDAGFTGNLQLIMFFLFYCIYLYYERKDDNLSWVIWFISALIIIWNSTTLYGYETQRNISRMLAKDFEGAESYAARGIGGYAYIYSLLFFVPITLGYVARYSKTMNILQIILLCVALISSVMVIFSAGYMIAILLFVVSALVLLFIKKRNKSMWGLFTLAISALLIFIFAEDLLRAVQPYVRGTMYETKIEDMIYSLTEGSASGAVEGRYERYIRSVKLFFQSPIWGQLSRTNIGKHSAILDKFAQFGILIGLLFTYFLMRVQTQMIKKEIDAGIAYSIFIVSGLFFLLNNIALAQGAMIFVYYLAVMKKIEKEKKI